ncbi:MAG: glutathione S-transferase family protein [Rhizobiaceae bacterium]
MTLTLYHYWSSTSSKKVRMTLNEKDVDWESHHINLHEFENWNPEYVKDIHPRGVVPALEHNGRVVYESNAVMEYIEDTFDGPSLRPADSWERAMMRVWLEKSEHVFHRNMHLISHNRAHAKRWTEYEEKYGREQLLEKVHSQPDIQRRRDEIDHAEQGIDEATVQFAIARVDEQLVLMDKALGDHEWLCGKTFSLADMAVLPFVERFKVNSLGDDVNSKKHLARWYDAMFFRPAVEKAFAFKSPV